MPLFELVEGASRKFYRIEHEGTRVSLHWARIDTKGEREILELATEAEALAEYNRQIEKRRDRGYSLVVDEAVPHDAATHRLARAAPLSKSPRFLFVHRRGKRFAWVEARD